MKAIWRNQVIAESNDIVEVEGNAYFPWSSVNRELLEDSSHTSVCPWKGTAHYKSLVVDGEKNTDALWFYPQPKEAASEIRERVAFWKGVVVQK